MMDCNFVDISLLVLISEASKSCLENCLETGHSLKKPRLCEFYLPTGQVFQMYDRESQVYLP